MRDPTFVPLTASLLQAIGASEDDAKRFATPLTQTMGQYDIKGPREQGHFLGQVFTESGRLRYTEEIWGPTQAQERYDVRPDLGNTIERDGDGEKYRGRGLIQVTGKYNYERFEKHLERHHSLRYSLLDRPGRVAEEPLNCICAGWFWASHNLSPIAAKGTRLHHVRRVTEVVNGGHNHLRKRVRFTKEAHKQLLRRLQADVNRKVPVFSPESKDFEIQVPHEPLDPPTNP
jgi:putative chitinase